MEKLFRLTLIFLIINSVSFAQESLTVYNVTGNVYVQKSDIEQELYKGDFFGKRDKIKINENSSIVFIDDNGQTYICSDTRIRRYKDILNNIKRNQSRFTINYLKYIWNQLFSKKTKEDVELAVYRGEENLVYPKDSSLVINTKIVFKWKEQDSSTPNYFFLKNKISNQLLKLEIFGTQLSLYKGNPIFNSGSELEWSISKNEYPNLRNIQFNKFKTVSRLEYKEELKKYDEFIIDLKALNHSKEEIDTILCTEFGLCEKLE